MALVLVVDDVRDGRELLARVLRQIGGHDAITADGGPAALDLVAERRPALILLDIAMPGMDGFEVLRRLKSLHDDDIPPVVMLTAFNNQANRDLAASLGAAGFFVKGQLDLKRLLETVDTLTVGT